MNEWLSQSACRVLQVYSMQTELKVEIYTSEHVGVFQEIHYISLL